MKNKIYIFDLDDTLIECHSNYAKVISEYIYEMVHHFNYFTPHPLEIAKKQGEIDQKLVSEKDYTIDRFPLSLVETYKYFHDSFFPQEEYNYEFMDKVEKLGYSIFDIVPKELPNAINMLERFKFNDIPRYILTAGDFEPQSFKIESTKIKEYFDKENIFINNRKGVDEFQEVLDKIKDDFPDAQLKDIVMIGDSLRNDIQPAAEIGINAIYLNVKSWSFNDVVLEHNFSTLNDLYELEDYIFNS